MNEPRVEHGLASAVQLQAWIAEMASYVKRMARFQLLTVGVEGMYQPSNCQYERCAFSVQGTVVMHCSHHWSSMRACSGLIQGRDGPSILGKTICQTIFWKVWDTLRYISGLVSRRLFRNLSGTVLSSQCAIHQSA